MAGILDIPDLPSDDEQDQDYDPTREEDAGDGGKAGPSKLKGPKRGRGVAKEEAHEEDGEDAAPGLTTKQLAKKARVDALWEQLKQPARAAGSGPAGPSKPAASGGMNLASLCKPVKKPAVVEDKNRNWMAQLGFARKASSAGPEKGADVSVDRPAAVKAEAEAGPARQIPQQSGGDLKGDTDAAQQAQPRRDLSAAAAAALSAARAAASATQPGQVSVTETRRFAGKDVQMTVSVAEGDAEKQQQKRNKAGLDAVLASLQAAKKANVLDKSRSDWTDFKKSDTQVEDELEAYKKSSDKYLDKVDFLKRSELKVYEKERDARLGTDIRSRGRL